ncbi:hypothetical protein KY285_030262 [Solanum tuberosum]|nr:hypothetical protein KY285_030262 [Solanum tuberosum]
MELPSGVTPPRGIENQIDFLAGSQCLAKPAHRSSSEYIQELQRQVEELFNKGYERKTTSPCVVPIQLVPKKDGAWRICVDLWAIRKIILRYCHHIPRLDDMIDGLNGYCVLSKMAHPTPCHKWDDASNVAFCLMKVLLNRLRIRYGVMAQFPKVELS